MTQNNTQKVLIFSDAMLVCVHVRKPVYIQKLMNGVRRKGDASA